MRQSETANGTADPFVYNLAEGLPTILQDGTTKYVTGPGGLPLEQVTSGGAVEYYVQDQLGSTRGLLDGSGNVTATYTYGAYGELKGSAGSGTTPFGYAGQYTDSESGLQYLRARYYDPSSQQFLTVDPLVGLTGEPYAYTSGNPLNGADPSGLWCILSCVGHALSGAAGLVSDVAGQVANNAGTIIPVAVYGGAVVVSAGCAFFTAGVCLAGEAFFGTSVFTAGAWFLTTMGPPGPTNDFTDEGAGCPEGPYVDLTTPERRTHILEGDATGGGHRFGMGRPGKSEFPAGWSDDRIIHEISDVATDPASHVSPQGKTTIVKGTRDGVDIRVIIKGGKIITGYPTNMPKNP